MKKHYKLFLLSIFIIGMFVFKINSVKAYDCTYYAQDGTELAHNYVTGKIIFFENGKNNWETSLPGDGVVDHCYKYIFYNRQGGPLCGLDGCAAQWGSNREDMIADIEEISQEGFDWYEAIPIVNLFTKGDASLGDGDSRYKLFYYHDDSNFKELNKGIDDYNTKFITSIGTLAEKSSNFLNLNVTGKGSEEFAINFFSNNICPNLSFKKELKSINDEELVGYQNSISETLEEIKKIIALADELTEHGKSTIVPLLDVNNVFTDSTLSGLSNAADNVIKENYYETISNSLIEIKNNYNKFFPYATNGEDNKYTEYLNCISSKNDLLKEEIDKRVAQDAENQKLLEAQKKANEIKETIAGLVDQLVRGIDSNFFKDNGAVDCSGILGQDIIDWLKMAFTFIQIATVLIVIFTTILDFTKAVTSGDADIMKKVWKNFSRRLIVLVFLFLAPVLIEFILKIFQISGTDPNNPLCL